MKPNLLRRVFMKISNPVRLQGLGVLLLIPAFAFSQALTIESCQEKAKANYPLVKQYGLIEKTARYNIDNANRGYLPQLTLSAKATYQSDVTQIPSALSDILSTLAHKTISFQSLPKDQYQAVLEASQLIWDGGVISAQNKITKAGTEVEKQKLEVDLYALKDRVNQLYFGILLLDEQMKQTDILKNDLQINFNRVAALLTNGVASQPDIDAIKVELINTDQRISDIKNTRKTYGIMLSALCGVEVTDKTELKKPETDLSALNESNNHRPELSLFDAQAKLYENQKNLVTAANLPRVGAFVQGGYGLPALTFLFNNNLVSKQQRNEIEKIQSSIKSDDEIIGLRQNIKKSTQVKQINGTASVSDLIRDVNAENQARQLKSLHEIQLLMNVYQLKNNINN